MLKDFSSSPKFTFIKMPRLISTYIANKQNKKKKMPSSLSLVLSSFLQQVSSSKKLSQLKMKMAMCLKSYISKVSKTALFCPIKLLLTLTRQKRLHLLNKGLYKFGIYNLCFSKFSTLLLPLIHYTFLTGYFLIVQIKLLGGGGRVIEWLRMLNLAHSSMVR